MKHPKTFVIFFIINLIIGLLVPILFGADVINVLASNGRYAFPIIIVLVGVLLGYIASLLLEREREKVSYFIGQALSCIAFSLFIIINNYNWWQHNKNYANVESNQDVMEYFVNEDEPYIRTAFKKLEASFANPNEFNLHSFHVQKQDTLLHSVQDTLYTVYFTYFLNNMEQQEHLSKFTIFQNKTTPIYIHQLADTTSDYQDVKRAFREDNKEHIKETEQLIIQMQEKGDQAVIDSLTKSIK